MNEDYVNFETAKLLKEKGFDWEVHRSYLVNDNVFIPGDISDVPLRKDAIRIPTLQMAMKWLREVHNYNIEIDTIGQKSRNTLFWRSVIYNLEHDIECYREENFKSYEEACETAIKYCLEELI